MECAKATPGTAHRRRNAGGRTSGTPGKHYRWITGSGTHSENIMIFAGDLIEAGGIGNLAAPEVQSELDPWLEGIEFLIVDNLSSLTAVIRDNDAESWGPIQEWLLKLRRRGISVLIVHHAGKDGQQRGTSRREDVLDTSISLRRSADYSPPRAQNSRFIWKRLADFLGIRRNLSRPSLRCETVWQHGQFANSKTLTAPGPAPAR